MFRVHKLSSTIAVLSVVSLGLSTQAADAGGRIGFTVNPKGQDAEVIRTGLELYSLTRSLRKKNRARVEQQGRDNSAAISQRGENNNARIFQRGRGNSGSISQNGNNNSFALFQFGKKGNTAVTQNGDGNVGLRFEDGW